MRFGWLLSIVASVFKPFVGLLTENIKTELETFVKQLYVKAEKTPNVWDDYFVKMLADILNIEV